MAVGLGSAAAGAVVGMASSALAGPSGWKELRWTAAAAWTASAFATCSVIPLLSASPQVVIAAAGCQYSLAALHVLAWLLDAARPLRLRALTVRGWMAALVPLALLAAVPGLAFRAPVRTRTVGWLGAAYRDPTPTLFAHLMAALVLLQLTWLVALHLRAWRRGVPHAAARGWTLLVLLLAGAEDALGVADVIDIPDLLAPASLVPVIVIASLVSARFVADARGLARLRLRLERRIHARTRALALSREALQRTEAAVSLGRMASRAAHEVNNPATCVMANVLYASGELAREDARLEDVHAALKDALEAARRLRELAGRLSDAGGAVPAEPRRVLLAPLVEDAVAIASDLHPAVRVDVDVDGALTAAGDSAILSRALVDLVANAIHAAAARHPGRVAIRAARSGDWVTLRIVDDGPGMDEVVLRRLGEPFFTTRPFESAGLGVATGRALIGSLGGRLRFESNRGAGTTALVELPAKAWSARRYSMGEGHGGREREWRWPPS